LAANGLTVFENTARNAAFLGWAKESRSWHVKGLPSGQICQRNFKMTLSRLNIKEEKQQIRKNHKTKNTKTKTKQKPNQTKPKGRKN